MKMGKPTIKKYLLPVIGMFFLLVHQAGAFQSQSTGFIDNNNDGINDLFSDTNGDGINDLTGQAYMHLFRIIDNNGDGINDFYIDIDGNGINDMVRTSILPQEIDDNIIDYDRNGINDITGIPYNINNLQGLSGGLIDYDGNGVDDRLQQIFGKAGMRGRDLFIDKNGDGINDNRTKGLGIRGRKMRGRKGKGKGKGKGGGKSGGKDSTY